MKVKVFRSSGNPVDPKKAAEYQEEWKAGFDEIWNDDTKPAEERTALIDEFEVQLKDKYNDLTIVEWDMPTSGKKWNEKLSEYGNIMITTNVENGELLFVINDMPF